jgi:metal-sulfur cluster biosynthetic enzyme
MVDMGLVTAVFTADTDMVTVDMAVTLKAGRLMQQQIPAEIPVEEMEEEVYDSYNGA